MSKVSDIADEIDKLPNEAIGGLANLFAKLANVSTRRIVAQTTQVEAPVVIEPTEFDVILQAAGASKISVIKEVRAITKLGLAEAKALVESAPCKVKEAVSQADAETIVTQLTTVGAVVCYKPVEQ